MEEAKLLIDGGRIRDLIEQAQNDSELRVRLFHCPEKVIAQSGLSEDEARAIRTGDLSGVDLDDESLAAGRKLFSETPTIEGQVSGAAQYMLFSSKDIQSLCA
jgi:hypothetical protein